MVICITLHFHANLTSFIYTDFYMPDYLTAIPSTCQRSLLKVQEADINRPSKPKQNLLFFFFTSSFNIAHTSNVCNLIINDMMIIATLLPQVYPNV